MSISRDEAKVIAREILERTVRKYGITISDIRSGDYDLLVRANAWATGIEITHESGETWTPSPLRMLPGSANHAAAAEAEANGRLRYTASECGKLKHLIEESSRHKVSFEACYYVFSKLLKQRSDIPPDLAEFGEKVFRNEISSPNERGGIAGKKDLGQACLVEAIYEMAKVTGLKPQGNSEKKTCRHDAAYYVANAACIGVDTTKKAWAAAKTPEKDNKNPGKNKTKFISVRRPDVVKTFPK